MHIWQNRKCLVICAFYCEYGDGTDDVAVVLETFFFKLRVFFLLWKRKIVFRCRFPRSGFQLQPNEHAGWDWMDETVAAILRLRKLFLLAIIDKLRPIRPSSCWCDYWTTIWLHEILYDFVYCWFAKIWILMIFTKVWQTDDELTDQQTDRQTIL